MRIWVNCCRLLLPLDHRSELVLETTVDDARRVRQIPDVNHISQRKVGQNGRVRITVDMPEFVIPKATSHSCIWSRSSLCATTGLVVFSAHQRNVDFWSCFVRVTEVGPCRHFYRSAFR